jgi:hypothetical protein
MYHVTSCYPEGHTTRTVVLWGALFERFAQWVFVKRSEMSRKDCFLSPIFLQDISTAWKSPEAKNIGNKKFWFILEKKIGYIYIYIYIYILQSLKESHPRNNRLLGLCGIAWGRTCLYCPLLLPDLLKGAGCKTIAVHLNPPPKSSSPNVKDTLG